MIIDVKKQRRKKDSDRYARMTNKEKQEKLKKRREGYQRNKTIKNSTQLQKKYTQVRKKHADLNPEQKRKMRPKHPNMQVEQKKPRIEPLMANREFSSNTPCKESM